MTISTRMRAAGFALAVMLSSACVPAGAQRVGDLRIEDPWVRATPPGAHRPSKPRPSDCRGSGLARTMAGGGGR